MFGLIFLIRVEMKITEKCEQRPERLVCLFKIIKYSSSVSDISNCILVLIFHAVGFHRAVLKL